jgi:hypothetical protein
MLAGRSGGRGYGAEKVWQIKKVGILRYIPSTKYFILVDLKKSRNKMKKETPFHHVRQEKVYPVTALEYPKM